MLGLKQEFNGIRIGEHLEGLRDNVLESGAQTLLEGGLQWKLAVSVAQAFACVVPYQSASTAHCIYFIVARICAPERLPTL